MQQIRELKHVWNLLKLPFKASFMSSGSGSNAESAWHMPCVNDAPKAQTSLLSYSCKTRTIHNHPTNATVGSTSLRFVRSAIVEQIPACMLCSHLRFKQGFAVKNWCLIDCVWDVWKTGGLFPLQERLAQHNLKVWSELPANQFLSQGWPFGLKTTDVRNYKRDFHPRASRPLTILLNVFAWQIWNLIWMTQSKKLKWYPNKQTRTWNFCSWKLEFGIDSPKPLQNLHCPDPIYGWEAVTTLQGFRRFKPRMHWTDASAAAMAAAETEGRQLKASVSLVTDPGAVKAAGWALPLTKSWDSIFWNQKNASSEIVGKKTHNFNTYKSNVLWIQSDCSPSWTWFGLQTKSAW